MKKIIFFSMLVMMILAACSSPQGSSDPEAVMEAYEAAWNNKDLQAVLDLYGENAVEVNGRGVFVGRDEIEGVLSHAIEGFSLDCGNYATGGTHVKYDCVLIRYANNLPAGEYYETVVVDGKILANILTGRFEP